MLDCLAAGLGSGVTGKQRRRTELLSVPALRLLAEAAKQGPGRNEGRTDERKHEWKKEKTGYHDHKGANLISENISSFLCLLS